jgi:glycyl-tRNA synthetase beta chain
MSSNADFLVEIGTEELPPKALQQLEHAFADGVSKGLADAGLAIGTVTSFATPRRLAILIQDLTLSQSTQKIEKRGPPVSVAYGNDGEPTRAALAFAEGCGIDVSKLQRLKSNKGEWLVYRAEEPGQDAAKLLPGIVETALAALPIPKRMRWGSNDAEFVRPVHWVVMLLGKSVVEANLFGLPSGNLTRGHRFHAPEPIKISAPAEYSKKLEKQGHVIAGFEERRARIRNFVEDAATKIGGKAIIDPKILAEVTALVEWPVPISGHFDAEFLRLPEEVLIATLQDHQRYFPVRSESGSLMPDFIAMSNLDSRDIEQVRMGNERVVRPRLSDAAFFWDQDCSVSLDSRRTLLKDVVFQRGLGSLHDKSERVANLAVELCDLLGAQAPEARRAADLAKTDLLTGMVGEFPELQGRMGYYYALNDGESDAVACAIRDQYLPRYAGDRLPKAPESCALALADRLDSVAGVFALGQRPSGNKDPFGSRRATLGILRILIEQRIDMNLSRILRLAIAAQPAKVTKPDELLGELYEFFIDRLRTYYLDGQAPGFAAGDVTPEMFESVRVRQPESPLDFHERLVAVKNFMGLEAAESLASANKRIANILRSAEIPADSVVDSGLFETDEEKRLQQAVAEITPAHAKGLEQRDYTDVLKHLSGLREPVDAFFDGVMVMTDDVARRRNRVAQLTELRRLFLDVADLSCIPKA